MPKKFILSDESVNAYGFRVLTDGIRMNNFKKNPVGFFNHETGGWWSNRTDYAGPIIRWQDVAKEDGKLVGTPVFDTKDPLGIQLHNKVEDDFIRAASIGFRILKTSSDPKDMIAGQSQPTITECELMEVSVVDIPANKNAVALYDPDGKRIELNDHNISIALKAGLPAEISLKENSMKLKITAALTALAQFFGLAQGQDHEVEVTPEKLTELNQFAVKAQAAEASLAAAQTQVAQLTTQVATLTAEIAELKKPAVPPAKPSKEGNDPVPAENDQKEELTDTDKEMRAWKKKYNLKPAKA